jgi:MinD superfamily P-loop ATPase
MPGARYVLLGLASARSPWFRELAQWANAAVVPVEFLKCVSAEEARARLATGRPFSAVIVDSAAPGLDRDLIEAAQQAGCAVIVVDGRSVGRNWTSLGVNAVLAADFGRKDLVDVLAARCVKIGRTDTPAVEADDGPVGHWHAPLAAVCGPGGTGASTAAIALSQGLAEDVRSAGSVLLVDLALRAEQAMLHDARDVIPGVQELIDLFRSGRPTADEIRQLAFSVRDRDYALLLGLRRSQAWSTIRPRAFCAALDALRQTYRVVVADVDPDVEGEDEGGSMDVEERHTMARGAISAADAVIVVGSPTMKGLHSLVRVVADLLAFGIPGVRVLPVVNRAPKSSRARAELTRALAELLPRWAGAEMASPLFLPERRVDEALRDGVRLPDALTEPLARAFAAVVARADVQARRPETPQVVAPGTLARWAEVEPAP